MKKTIQQRIVLPVLRTRQQVNKWSPACKKWVRRAYKGASWVVTDFSRFDYSALFREDGLWRNLRFCSINIFYPEVPRWLNGEESSCQAGDPGLITESGTSPRERNGNPLQYSCLGNPMDRGAWRATVYGVTKNRTWLSTHACLLFRSYTRAREHESESELIKWMILGDSMIRGLLFAPQLKIGVLLNPLVFCLSFAPCKLEQLDL